MRVIPTVMVIVALSIPIVQAWVSCPSGQETVVIKGEKGQVVTCGTPAIAIKKVDPTPPPKKRQYRGKGLVVLQALVTEEGSVESVSVILEKPKDLGLAEATMEAVKQWRYKPAIVDNKRVASYATVNFGY